MRAIGGIWAALAAAAAVSMAGAAGAQSQPIADPTKTATPDQPADKPADKSDKSSGAAAEKPAAKPADKPGAGAADKPTDKPTGGSPPSAFSFNAAYTVDLLDNLSGGRSTGPGKADLLKLSAAYDGSVVGHDGLNGLVSVEHTFGSSFTVRKVGGLQNVTAAEAEPAATRLYEAWLQQTFWADAAGVKVGLIDLNTTFDVQETAALFLNASHGIGADIGDTGLNGPSIYPTTALAAAGFYRPNEDWTAQLGVFDGTAGDPAHRSDFFGIRLDRALVIGQVERRFGDRARIEVGAYSYSGRFPALDRFNADGTPRAISGNAGVYGLVEGQLIPQGEQGGGLSGWIRAGLANGDINTVGDYLGAGLVYAGPLPGRDKDEAGIAFARAGLGSGARVAGFAAGADIHGAETVIEATYRYVLSDRLTLQPDLQYVIRPHGDAAIPNALVVGLRLALTFSK